jgi:DNA-binding response OmpR family regulator
MHILVVTRRPMELAEFTDALSEGTGLPVRFTDGWANAQAVTKELVPSFAVLDEGLRGGPPLELAKRIIRENAMINMAVVSPLSGEEFHEASEGLGILAQVPEKPTEADGTALAKVFRRFM